MNISVKSKPDCNLDDEKQSQYSKVSQKKRSGPKCTIDRSLALTLHVSRLFGVAPVTFERKHNSIFVAVSPGVYAYSCILLFVLHAGILSGVVLDFCLDTDQNVHSATASLAWLLGVLVVTALMTFGVHKGPERMNCMVRCLNVIEKVNSGIHKHLPGKQIERTVLIIGIMFLLIGNSIYLFEFYTFVNEALLGPRDMMVVCLYFSLYLEYMATFPLELQFMDIVMKIVYAQKTINNALLDLVCQIDTRALHENVVDMNSPSNNANFESNEYVLNTTGDVEMSDYNISTDEIELFHYIMLSYGAITDVMKQINDSYAVVLILMLLSFFLHLVLAPYYLITYCVNTEHGREVSAIVQIFITTLHVINILIVVEPAHRNTEEMENTQVFLGQVARRITSSNKSVIHELDLFYKQILLNSVSFTPMGICSLTRPFITTIFCGITTYLVIILQFRANLEY